MSGSLLLPGYFVAALIVGLLAIPSRLGFVGGALLSLLVSPLLALVILLAVHLIFPKPAPVGELGQRRR